MPLTALKNNTLIQIHNIFCENCFSIIQYCQVKDPCTCERRDRVQMASGPVFTPVGISMLHFIICSGACCFSGSPSVGLVPCDCVCGLWPVPSTSPHILPRLFLGLCILLSFEGLSLCRRNPGPLVHSLW